MQVVVAGGMGIAVDAIETLCDAGVTPVHAIGYPPSLSHRSNYASLAEVARKYEIPLLETSDLNARVVGDMLRAFRPDWLLIIGWSQLLKDEYLDIPAAGTLGFHMSHLPEGRGRAPVAWTLIKGLSQAWVTLQWLKTGADDGDIALQQAVDLDITDDAATLVPKVNALACNILRKAIAPMQSGKLPRRPQDESKATYWPRRRPEDGRIDWGQDVEYLYNFIRGVTSPFPGAFAVHGEQRWTILKCGILHAATSYKPGTVVGPYWTHGAYPDYGMTVAAKDGLLIFTLLMDETGKNIEGSGLAKLAGEWAGKQLQ